MKPNVTTFTAGAEEKDCSRLTLYRAADRGEIHTAEVGGTRMILLDDAFAEWQPQETGGRVHRNRARYDDE